jgi:hypothetical protein
MIQTKYIVVLSTFFALFSLIGRSQSEFQNVRIPNPKGKNAHGQTEPSIAIHPKDQNIIAAGTVLDGYYYSLDGGKSWKSQQLKSKYGVWGDPVLMFDTTGRIYYFHLSNYKKGTWLDRIVCQSAEAVDQKFDQGTYPEPNGTKAQDKHWTVLDQKTNVIYMTWTQFDKYGSDNPRDSSIILFSRSKDQGKTWSTPKRISAFAGDCVDDDNTVEGAVPAVGPNGEIYVVWSGPKGLVMQVSTDGGESWLKEERHVTDHPGGWTIDIPGLYRANGLPILVCDLSEGPNRGTLYLNWCDQRNGRNNTDVMLMSSKDGGLTWTEPQIVNQDDSKKQQFFTWMTVDQSNGNLYFVYYDRRNYEDNRTDVYLTVSRDGGETFIDHRISESPFIPNGKVFFGDYLNIAAVNGVIALVWPRMDLTRTSLWTTTIREEELLRLIGQ